MTHRARYIDAASGRVLGVWAYLDRLSADSEAGRALQDAPRLYGSDDAEAWREEVVRLRSVEAWEGDETELRANLSQLPGLERPLRLLRAGESLTDVELFELKRFCYYGHRIADACQALVDVDDVADELSQMMESIHPEPTPSPRFHLTDRLDEELASARAVLREAKKAEKSKRRELEDEVLREAGDGRFDLRGNYHPGSDVDTPTLPHLQHCDGHWRLDDETYDALLEELEDANREMRVAEERVRRRLSDRLRDRTEWLEACVEALAELDFRFARVRLKRLLNATWGEWRDEAGLTIEAGREPRIEMKLREAGETIQPIDVDIGDDPVVVTGPNMGGKSALLQLIGICQWCAQHALPVPAETFRFSPVENIVYVGSEEPEALGASAGLSSFGREVRRLVDWWDVPATTLWLLDEVGRGTHPDEGASIACDVVSALHDAGHTIVAATHFPRLASLSGARRYRVAGLTDETHLTELLSEAGHDLEAIRAALGAVMDYRPLRTKAADIPRDARRVAEALGLQLDRGEE